MRFVFHVFRCFASHVNRPSPPRYYTPAWVLLASIFWLVLPPQLSAQSLSPGDFRVFDNWKQEEISLDQLASSLGETDVVFFGEEHNDSLGHMVQDALYANLLKAYSEVSLSLEMFETDCQLVLDEYLDGHISESKFRADARPWGNYKTAYRPLVENARDQGQPVVAANAPRRYVNLVSRNGLDALKKMEKTSLAYLPPMPIYTDDSAYYKRFVDIMGGAQHTISPAFFHAQCLWDASMGYRIYRHWRKAKPRLILHLNGRFHTDYRGGTYHQLQRYGKKLKLSNITCHPVEDLEGFSPNWGEQKEMGDYLILTRQL